MEKILKYLEQLELSEIEAKLYLTLLETGPVSVRDIATLIKIKRTTTYLYIEQLMQKGLITKVTVGAKTQIAPVQPEVSLEHLVHEKVDKAKLIQDKFPSVLQNIEAAFPKMENTGDAEIKYYKGKLGVRKIYEEALQAKELRSYFNIELIQAALPDNPDFFVEALKKNNTIKIFEFFQDTEVAKKQILEFQSANQNKANYSYKILPQGVTLSAADILIYDGNVAIVNVKNQLTGVVFRNTEYYNNSKELFDLLWKILP